MTRVSNFPFLSIGKIFSFSGGAKKRSNKKRTKRTNKQSNKRTKKTNKRLNKKSRKKNLSRRKATRKKVKSKKRAINKRTRAKTIKKLPKIYSKKKRSCNCDDSRTYTGKEPSPKGLGFCAHCIPLNVSMKGLDGNLWENKKFAKGKRWVKVRVDMN